MSQTEISRKIQTLFFENADASQIPPIINEQFESGELASVIDMLDCILDARLEKYQLEAVISSIEDQFLINHFDFLCKYLFVLHDRNGDEEMARFYLDLCSSSDNLSELQDEEEYKQRTKKYAFPEASYLSPAYFQNNFDRCYFFNGENKAYSVHSFSDEIGQNMTLLKTPYGDIIFDCGAKCNKNEAQIISKDDFFGFLLACNSSVDRIKAVIISHAHMDHYGSLPTLINSGISPTKVFIGEETRKLIAVAARGMISLENTRPLSSFFVANNKVKIEPFRNGHIVGSEGYIVSFDNINVVYTGDYCLHDQKTVMGLNPTSISNNQFVKKFGVDCLITESTYGYTQRYLNHISAEFVLRRFVSKLLKLGYKVVFPAFAIGRSQEIVLMINGNHNILLDGLSVKISREYEQLTGIPIFNANTRYSTETDDKVNNLACNDVIIASSGMLAQSSTSSNYVEGLLSSDEKTAIIITGYMDSSEDSYGNDLLMRWKRKENVLLNVSLSAHASYDEIIALIGTIAPQNIVAIHGNGIAHRESPRHVMEPLVELPTNSIEGVSNVDSHETIPKEEGVPQGSDKTHINELPSEHATDNPILVRDEHDSKTADYYLTIESMQLRAKMINVSKTGQGLVDVGGDLSRSQPLAMACKLLLKFLKKESRYNEISDYLDSLDNYALFWEFINECVNNGFSFPVCSNRTNSSELQEHQIINADNSGHQIDSISLENKLTQNNRLPQESFPKEKKRLKRRIHELAKDLNLRTKDVVAILERYSIPVKNHMQILSVEEINIVLEHLTHQMQVLEDDVYDCQNIDIASRRDPDNVAMENKQKEKQAVLSDVMIVKCSENNYYVSEKIAGRKVYLDLLEERSHTSNHYSSMVAARAGAEELRKSLLDRNPNCEIKEYDIKKFPPNGSAIVRYVNDNNGNALFGVSEKGKKVFFYREGEEQYQYIDILKYEKCMAEEAALFDTSSDFNYYNFGFCRGIEVARMAALPHLYYEIYKAEELIKTFSDDPELFECDSQFYSGYIESIKKSIAIQKECIVTRGNWRIILINMKGMDLTQLKKYVSLDFLGSYIVDEYKSASECNDIPSERNIYIVLANSKDGSAELISELGLTGNSHYIYSTQNFLSKNINRAIERLVVNHFRLGSPDPSLKIPEYWVESIEQFDDDDVEVDGGLSDGAESKSSFGTSAIPDRLLKAYRLTIAAMFSDYSVICAEDISCLKGMCNRCIKHDQHDWKTTFEYLGCPELKTLKSFVSDAGLLRDNIRDGSFDGVVPFREKYQNLLLSMLKNICDFPSDAINN